MFYYIITWLLPFLGVWLYRFYDDKRMLVDSILSCISLILCMFNLELGLGCWFAVLVFIIVDDNTKTFKF